MVEAILTGLNNFYDLSNVSIFSPTGVSAQKLAQKLGARQVTDLNSVKADLLLIGCKPQQIKNLKTLMGDRFSDIPAISILAALPEKTQADILGCSALVRVMPNLAVSLNQGVSLVSSDSAPMLLERVKELFSLLGKVETVSEAELEDLTLLTGSSPAFFYEFASYLAQSFQSLTPGKREDLIRQSLIGAALTIKDSEQSLEGLIQNVTSKGGVTIAVLEEFRRLKLSKLVNEGVKKGHERATELRSIILQS